MGQLFKLRQKCLPLILRKSLIRKCSAGNVHRDVFTCLVLFTLEAQQCLFCLRISCLIRRCPDQVFFGRGAGGIDLIQRTTERLQQGDLKG